MTAQVLSGKEVVAKLQADLKPRVAAVKKKGLEPLLSIVIVGDAASSCSYIRALEKACLAVGVTVQTDFFPAGAGQEEVEDHLEALNEDPQVHGVIVMRPLPAGIEEEGLAKTLSLQKDVDCFNPINLGRVMAGDKDCFPPATARAVVEILHHFDIPIRGRQVAVIGRSLVVGRPLAMLLLDEDATVNICHSRTADLAAACRQADIVVAAAGKPGLVTADMIKPGAVVIDVGINFVGGKITGDVDFAGVSRCAAALTPVPGGVGSVTSTVVVKHVVAAAEKQAAL